MSHMDFSIFWIVTISSALSVYPGFEFFQYLAIRAGQIPPKWQTTWKGRNFLHWYRYKVLLVGDLVFLSLLNGFAAAALMEIWSTIEIFWLLTAVFLGLTSTMWWVTSAKRAFASGDLRNPRWDWCYTAPNGQIPLSGTYHLAYFWLESSIIIFCAMYLFWQPIGIVPRSGIALSMLGYIVTLIYDIFTVGIFLKPLIFRQEKKL